MDICDVSGLSTDGSLPGRLLPPQSTEVFVKFKKTLHRVTSARAHMPATASGHCCRDGRLGPHCQGTGTRGVAVAGTRGVAAAGSATTMGRVVRLPPQGPGFLTPQRLGPRSVRHGAASGCLLPEARPPGGSSLKRTGTEPAQRRGCLPLALPCSPHQPFPISLQLLHKVLPGFSGPASVPR